MGNLGHLQQFAWTLIAFFLAIMTGSATLAGAFRFGLVPGYKVFRRGIEKAEAAADLVKAQLTPNGGGSLLDLVYQNNALLANIHDRLHEGCWLFGATGVPCPVAHVTADDIAKLRAAQVEKDVRM